jgi:hypothetical protein
MVIPWMRRIVHVMVFKYQLQDKHLVVRQELYLSMMCLLRTADIPSDKLLRPK